MEGITDEMSEMAMKTAMMADAGYDVSQKDYIMALGLLALLNNPSAIDSIKAYWRLKVIRSLSPTSRRGGEG